MAFRLVSRVSSKVRNTVPLSRQFSALVFADHDNAKLTGSTLNLVNAATQLDQDVTVLVAGKDCGAVATEAAAISGVTNVVCADGDAYHHHIAEDITSLITDLQKEKGYKFVLGSANSTGKNIMPRVAASLDVAPLSDVIAIKSEDTFVRPIYAGNALATYKSKDPVKVMTIRATNFDAAAASGGSAAVEAYAGAAAGTEGVSWKADELTVSERPELTAAKIVVSGGRGLGSEENFGMMYKLADKLNAAVGASRAAVDAGYAPNDMQVGQTGKVVAPDLYIAFGISGAIQHLAGMKDSKTIVAVNKDPEAAIFQVADYGVVGDLFKVVPEMDQKL